MPLKTKNIFLSLSLFLVAISFVPWRSRGEGASRSWKSRWENNEDYVIRERRPHGREDVEADKKDGRWTIKRGADDSHRLPIVINEESVSLRAYYPTRSN